MVCAHGAHTHGLGQFLPEIFLSCLRSRATLDCVSGVCARYRNACFAGESAPGCIGESNAAMSMLVVFLFVGAKSEFVLQRVLLSQLCTAVVKNVSRQRVSQPHPKAS